MITRTLATLMIALGVAGTAMAQMNMMEVNTSMEMSDTLNSTSTGGGGGRTNPVNATRNIVGPGGNVPGPGPSVPGPGPVPVGPGPVPAGPTGPTAPSPGGPEAPPSQPVPGAGGSVSADKDSFRPEQAAQLANQGFEAMRMQRFDEGLERYRQAKDIDPKNYTAAFNTVENFVKNIRKFGVGAIQNIPYFEGPVPTTIGQYYGWTSYAPTPKPVVQRGY